MRSRSVERDLARSAVLHHLPGRAKHRAARVIDKVSHRRSTGPPTVTARLSGLQPLAVTRWARARVDMYCSISPAHPVAVGVASSGASDSASRLRSGHASQRRPLRFTVIVSSPLPFRIWSCCSSVRFLNRRVYVKPVRVSAPPGKRAQVVRTRGTGSAHGMTAP